MRRIATLTVIVLALLVTLSSWTFAEEQLVVASWGGTLSESQRAAYYKPFEAATGIKVIEDSSVGFGKLKAMVMSKAVEWDVADLGERQVQMGANEGLLEPIDYTVIDKTRLLPQGMSQHGVATFYYSWGIGYGTRKYSAENHPKTWKEFWDVDKFPGRRSLRDSPKGNLEFALMADGVAPDKLYPLDVERAFKSLDKIKKHIHVWWRESNQAVQMLIDGEIDFVSVYQGTLRRVIEKEQGAKADAELNQALLLSDWWVVPKGARNKSAAMKFINFASDARNQANISNIMPISPTNPKAYDFISKERAKILPTSEENLKKVVFFNEEWWGENSTALEERWKNWLLK
jgi:putative spermidine/putrescine transport system substrate-binding protein